MPDNDMLEVISVTAKGPRINDNAPSHNKFARVTANCPCDQCPLATACQVECVRFKGWVQTGK